MPRKGKDRDKGKGHRAALSFDSSLGNLSLTPRTEEAQSSAASHKDDDEVDIIGYDRVAMKPDADIRATAQRTFDTASKEATYSQVGDRLAYGNSLGHIVLAEREDYRTRLGAVETELASQKDLVTSQGRKISALEAKINVLKSTSEGYLQIRQRFLDTFRRDILGDPEARWAKTITAGNKAAHDGDSVTDASLFQSGFRRDESLMIKIYGLTAQQVLWLSEAGDYDSIALLDARATLKSIKGKAVPQDIEEAWADFVSRLEKDWGEVPKEDPLSPLSQAYYRFWKAYGKLGVTSGS